MGVENPRSAHHERFGWAWRQVGECAAFWREKVRAALPELGQIASGDRREGREVSRVNQAKTIAEFHAALHSEEQADPAVEAVRGLTTIDEPEEFASAISPQGIYWGAWHAV
jgi:hypothetical protein